MAKTKGDIEIGRRAYEEVVRLFDVPSTAKQRIGITRNVLYGWRDGIVPGALWLAKLHYAGADVIYILTGRKTMEVN
jgi:hypothetical protein